MKILTSKGYLDSLINHLINPHKTMKKIVTMFCLALVLTTGVQAEKLSLNVGYNFSTAEGIKASASMLRRAVWVGNSDNGVAPTYSNTTDVLSKDVYVSVYKVGSHPTGTNGAGQATNVICQVQWRFLYSGANSGDINTVNMSYVGEETSNDRWKYTFTFTPKYGLKLQYWYRCSEDNGSTWGGYDSNGGANYTYEIARTGDQISQPTSGGKDGNGICNWDAQWRHPLYHWRTSFGTSSASWFDTGVTLADPIIQGNNNYAQATVQAVDTDTNFILSIDNLHSYSGADSRWYATNIAYNTCTLATNQTSGHTNSTLATAPSAGTYYTIRHRRTAGAGGQTGAGDENTNRAFAVMPTSTAPIEITGMEAAGADLGEQVDDDIHARGGLWDRGTQCSTYGSGTYWTNTAFNGTSYAPVIAKNQAVAVSGTYSGTIGNQYIYVRYGKTSGGTMDKLHQCSAGSGTFNCVIPEVDLHGGSGYWYYLFSSPVDFTTTGSNAVTANSGCKYATPTNTGCNVLATTSATNGADCLDTLSLDFWNSQLAMVVPLSKTTNVALSERFERMPNRNFEFGVSSSLAIDLASFTPAVSGNEVTLTWTPARASAASYIVERNTTEGWVEMGEVASNGVSAHTFAAKGLSYGINEFRIKTVVKGGEVSYSKSVVAFVEMPGEVVLNAAYPNPFSQNASIEFAVAQKQAVIVELVNAAGQKVATLYDATPEAGTSVKVALDGANLANGVYFVRLSTENGLVKTQSVNIVK